MSDCGCACKPGQRVSIFLNLYWTIVDLQRCVSFRYVCMLSHSVMSSSLQPRGPWPARLLCPQGFSRQEHWNGLPCPSPGHLPNPGIKPRFPALQVDSLAWILSHQGSPYRYIYITYFLSIHQLMGM